MSSDVDGPGRPRRGPGLTFPRHQRRARGAGGLRPAAPGLEEGHEGREVASVPLEVVPADVVPHKEAPSGIARCSIRFLPAASPGARTPYTTREALSERWPSRIPAPVERHPDPGPQ